MIAVLNFLSVFAFFTSISFLIVFQRDFNYYWDYVADIFAHDDSGELYDFIVVGAGSAGAVVANRLSKNNKVLVLDTGGDPLYPNSIPGLALHMVHRPQVDYSYKTVPQKFSSFAQTNNVSTWPRGKLLGGTSNLNYMVYMRGHPMDFDNWADITGDPEWSYENVLPAFKKVLNYNGKFKDNEKHYSGNPYGYLNVEEGLWRPLYQNFIDAAQELGYDNIDLNGPQRSGFGVVEKTQKNGKRFSTFASFLKHFMHRKNLKISRYSYVTKVELDKSNRAVGVRYIKHGLKRFARVSKEIILSAGTIESPKILLLSGIGPKEDLLSVGIKPKVELPVGKNLQDHVAVMLLQFIINETQSFIAERDMGLQTFWDYYVNGYGPLTNPTAMSGIGFGSSSFVSKEIDWPDIQYYIFAAGVSQNIDKEFSEGFGYRPEITRELFDQWKGNDSFILTATLARPKSRGELKLRDKNPLSPPLIDPRYLENVQDVKVLVEGLKFCVEMAEETEAFKKIGAKLAENPIAPCKTHKFKSDAYWKCYVEYMSITLYHHSSTCTMGRIDDPKAVTDTKLRVLKTKGLRVADASIMPVLVNGNTNAPSIMIGQKVSDMIREFWQHQFLVCDIFERLCNQKYEKCYYSRIV